MNKLKANYQSNQPIHELNMTVSHLHSENGKEVPAKPRNSLTLILIPRRDGYGRRERSEGNPGKVALTCAQDTKNTRNM